MLRTLFSGRTAAMALAAWACSLPAPAEVFDIATATGLHAPSFRGAANSTWVGWNTFGDGPGDATGAVAERIDDATPDIGTHAGRFTTTNGEDHRSSSTNYYAGEGAVGEDLSFETAGGSDGFTTVIVQANTLFGEFPSPIQLGPLAGLAPVQVLAAPNGAPGPAGGGQLFAKYEIPGPLTSPATLSIFSGPSSFVSFDKVVIDTLWSPDGYAAVSAIATPEPSAIVISAMAVAAMGGMTHVRRRQQ